MRGRRVLAFAAASPPLMLRSTAKQLGHTARDWRGAPVCRRDRRPATQTRTARPFASASDADWLPAQTMAESFPAALRQLYAGKDGSTELTSFVLACSEAFHDGYSTTAVDLELASLDRKAPAQNTRSSEVIRASFEDRASSLPADALERLWKSYSPDVNPPPLEEMQGEVVDYWMARMGNHTVTERRRWIILVYCVLKELNPHVSADKLFPMGVGRFQVISHEAVTLYDAGCTDLSVGSSARKASGESLVSKVAGSMLSAFAFQACIALKQSESQAL